MSQNTIAASRRWAWKVLSDNFYSSDPVRSAVKVTHSCVSSARGYYCARRRKRGQSYSGHEARVKGMQAGQIEIDGNSQSRYKLCRDFLISSQKEANHD